MADLIRTRGERIVCLGLRCSMACLTVSCHETPSTARTALCRVLSEHDLPQTFVADFAMWSLALHASRHEPLACLAIDSDGWSQDEALAVTLVALSQHQHCPALTACACALVGQGNLGRVLSATSTVARKLLAERIVLGPHPHVALSTDGASARSSKPLH